MKWWQIVLFGAYLACTMGLALHGLHALRQTWYFLRRVRAARLRQIRTIRQFHQTVPESSWPVVTTQLPIFNEADVVERVIRAAAAMEYPWGKHEIQVLDDSTDECIEISRRVAEDLRREGTDIRVLHRRDRTGYKAGALKAGMATARGDLITIFDADFVPPRDFLSKTVPLLLESKDVACVQGRWDHLNRDDSWLTRAQSVGLDGHFVIEQGARAWNGLFMNFNGTGGVWRRSAILAAGGWEGDTITEDLDLSYRAQLAGYRIVYGLDIRCPGEVPNTPDGLKSQQRRWARGGMQTARKLLGKVWHSDGSFDRKVSATFHLTQHIVPVLMVVLALLTVPVLLFVPFHHLGHWLWAAWTIALFSAACPCISYYVAGWALGHSRFTLRNIPGLVVLGSGLSLNNCVAALAGLVGGPVPFDRTPKSGSTQRNPRKRSRYTSPASRLWWAELLLGVYCLIALAIYSTAEKWLVGIFLGFYTVGYLSLGWASRPRLIEEDEPEPLPLGRSLVSEGARGWNGKNGKGSPDDDSDAAETDVPEPAIPAARGRGHP